MDSSVTFCDCVTEASHDAVVIERGNTATASALELFRDLEGTLGGDMSNSGHATVHVQPALMVSQLRSADRSVLFYAIKIPD